ncbi:Inositol phosphatase SIW14 [Lecanora helva]
MSVNSSLRQPNSEALALSQEATRHLQRHKSTGVLPIPVPFISNPESTEVWLMYERLLLSCLRTGDDKTAHLCLERLIERFGATNERVMGLRGMYQEAVASGDAALERILQEYNEVLAEDQVNTPIAKRRVALLQSRTRTTDAIGALVQLLESSPTDIEAWAELSELYVSQSLYSQATFCLEEVLLVAPNAWNMHARLGEILLLASANVNEDFQTKALSEATRRFCRSVELCDDYIRGFYGLKMVSRSIRQILQELTRLQASDRLLVALSEGNAKSEPSSIPNDGKCSILDGVILRKLNENATSRLAELIRTSPKDPHHYAEIIAAKDLLGKATQSRTR